MPQEGEGDERIPWGRSARMHVMSAVSIPSYEVPTGARLWRRLLVVAAVGQAVSSALVSTFGGAFTTADREGEPLIVPPGGTFTIWSVIIGLSIGYAIWAESDRRPDPALRNRLARPLLVTCVGFSVWLAAAELEPNWSTLVIFLIMLAALLRALAYAERQRATIAAWSPLAQVLLWGTLGLYTGWSSVAVWLNLTTALVGSGAPITTPAAIVGQVAILAGAAGTAVVIAWFTRGLLPYVATVAWALGGVVVSTVQEGSLVLATAAGVGLAIVLGTAVLARRRAEPHRRTGGPQRHERHE
jgi:hypothetical protein